jgi:N-carbamoyl-L-amino-acid hydrolase
MSQTNIRIDEDRFWASLMRSAEIGPGKAGGLRRLALSDSDREMRDLFVAWCRELGCGVEIDQAGNMFARRNGREDLPPVVIGSHLDTQAAGGRFDGILGVLAGLEILRTLADHDVATRRPIEVVDWSNEEGARFPPPMAASCVFAGVKPLDWLYALRDDDGLTYGEELARIGYRGEAPVGGRAMDSYFELHIEQDDVLDREGIPVGVVTGSFASRGMVAAFHGETAHSGPTPMEKRHNALVGAAHFIHAVNDIGWAFAPVGKATASRVIAWPNKNGILPEYAEATVDMRHRDPRETERMLARTYEALETAAAYARVDHEIKTEWSFGDEVFDAELAKLVRQCARELSVETMDMFSQAGHDAYYVSRVAPTALIFSPCIDGITHNEGENVKREPTFAAVNVLLHAVLKRAES